MKLRLQDVARVLAVPLEKGGEDVVVTGWSIDSRTVRPGDLFFAIRGPNHDGHKYVAEVLEGGAAAAIVDRDVETASQDSEAGGVILRVADVLEAMQELAKWARAKWGRPVIGVTGSAGKTTTKDVIAALLSTHMKTARNEGNLNNHVGLPLSILRLDDAAEAAVLEMGMNHSGEIRMLAEIAKPNVGVVTNVGYAHIENFDSVEGIAAAKRELVESLPSGGVAVLNADDLRVAEMAAAHAGRSILFGQSEAAQVRAEGVVNSPVGTRFRVGAVDFETQLSGNHNLSNVLAGIAVASVYGIAPEKLVDAVRDLAPGKMRGERLEHNGILIFNDCYNSNPEAVRKMLEVLRDAPARRRIAVLGEMLELGRWAEPLHRGVGDYAVRCGVDVLVGIRGAACHILDAARRTGLSASAAFFFDDAETAGRAVRALAQPGDAILFKGSRGVHVERALAEFLIPAEHSTEHRTGHSPGHSSGHSPEDGDGRSPARSSAHSAAHSKDTVLPGAGRPREGQS